MVQYGSILASMVIAATISMAAPAPSPRSPGLYTVPAEGLADGMYDVSLASDGSTIFELIESSNATTKAEPRDLNAIGLVARDSSGYGCGSDQVNHYDSSRAFGQFESWCGEGNTWSGKSKAFSSGSAVAYGCNYGSGWTQTCYQKWLREYYNGMDNSCNYEDAAWYSDTKGKVSYGRTYNGGGFC
jgi:hypothetical protein